MAILTQTGRAALAASVKNEPIHLAWGNGNPNWGTTKSVGATFTPEHTIALAHAYVGDVVVKNADETITYVKDQDYSVTSATGVVTRLASGAIAPEAEVRVEYYVNTPPETPAQATLLSEVGRRVVDEVEFVVPDPDGGITVPTGQFTVSATPTNHLFVRVKFDFADAATEAIREQGIFVGSATDPALPAGQKYFVGEDVVEPGILLLLQNSAAIIRQSSTRETFEFVVTF